MLFLNFVEAGGIDMSWKKYTEPEQYEPWKRDKMPATTHQGNMLKPKKLPEWCLFPSEIADGVDDTPTEVAEIGLRYAEFLANPI